MCGGGRWLVRAGGGAGWQPWCPARARPLDRLRLRPRCEWAWPLSSRRSLPAWLFSCGCRLRLRERRQLRRLLLLLLLLRRLRLRLRRRLLLPLRLRARWRELLAPDACCAALAEAMCGIRSSLGPGDVPTASPAAADGWRARLGCALGCGAEGSIAGSASEVAMPEACVSMPTAPVSGSPLVGSPEPRAVCAAV